MSETVKLANPRTIEPNPENPRIIFRADEMEALQESIKSQGILVPLSVYRDKGQFRILDGERRWRCALKLGLRTVPVSIQPKPDRLTNLMMMFAIHHRRNEWDPLPTALKLKTLEDLFAERKGRRPTESELAELGSLTRGEVRRYKKLLALPKEYFTELMAELEKPRSQQLLTVDHVLEVTKGAAALEKRKVISAQEEDRLRKSLLKKFRSGVIANTVAPRKLARIARAVQRKELSSAVARRVTVRLITDSQYSIDNAFAESVERVDFEHSVEQLVARTGSKLSDLLDRAHSPGKRLRQELASLATKIKRILQN